MLLLCVCDASWPATVFRAFARSPAVHFLFPSLHTCLCVLASVASFVHSPRRLIAKQALHRSQ